MGEKLFHGDETRWEVFAEVEGKTGHRWYLWVTQSASWYSTACAWRGADVPKTHFAKLRKDLVDVVLVCDRYSAYKCLAKDHDKLILAYCWRMCDGIFSRRHAVGQSSRGGCSPGSTTFARSTAQSSPS